MSTSSSARYIGLGAQATAELIPYLVEPFVEAAAITLQDQIVEEINSSSPAGRRYRIPGTRYRDGKKGQSRKGGFYTASAAGQAPAEREGIYRERWDNTPPVREGKEVIARVYNDATVGKAQEPLGAILEYGTRAPLDAADDEETGGGGMQPRPHIGPAIEKATPKIQDLAKGASW